MLCGPTWLDFSLATTAQIFTDNWRNGWSCDVWCFNYSGVTKEYPVTLAWYGDTEGRAIRANNLPTQADSTGSAILLQNGNNVCGKSLPYKRLSDKDDLDSMMKRTRCSHFQRWKVLSWRWCSRLRWTFCQKEKDGEARTSWLQMVQSAKTGQICCFHRPLRHG